VISQATQEEVPIHVRNRTRVLFWRAVTHELHHGRSKEGIAGAALYAAVREQDHPIQYKDILACTAIDEDQKLNHCYGVLCRELRIEIRPPDPRAHIDAVLKELNVSILGEIKDTAEEVIEAAMNNNLHSGLAPQSLAGAAVYEACCIEGEDVSMNEVAEAADVCSMTVSVHAKKLRNVGPRQAV